MEYQILVINPGSTSTKIAIYHNEKLLFEENISHSTEELSKYERIIDQLDFRKEMVIKTVKEKGFSLEELDAIVARGGLLRPLSGGTYRINQQMVNDLKEGVQGEHASNLAGLIAFDLASKLNIPAFTVDPVAVDEFIPEARISGIPEIERRSLSHALNIKATARQAARDLNLSFSECNFIVAHLGGGISIAPLLKGRIVDVNNANESGPFSPERCGQLPVGDLVRLAFSGKYTFRELKKRMVGQGGLTAYLGTNNCQEIEEKIKAGDEKVAEVYHAMIYQIAKEIGAMATVLKGEVDAIILTGGLAHSKMVTDGITEYVQYIAPVKVYPGAMEMLALCQGALRVLRREEEPLEYIVEGVK
ncbi:butyrate kinase [Anoxybacter fermentans]|uniref:Probable butyrate kinase n=1 Tax=Anoxybacter fermentans TaxID=1323375 RepID=A0A3S9SYP1_9FIRM|nr:butyrate kinase [Anoxybacter fermentans]AZR73447.1 butyrate kinase [Anoxybacter fermentans]